MKAEKSNGRIVALHGHHGVGKDSIADHLVATQGYYKLAFADGVYEDVADFLGVPLGHIADRKHKEVPQQWMSLLNVSHPDYRAFLLSRGEDLYQPRTSRYHLTKYGTDYMNTVDPLHWVNRVSNQVASVPGCKVVIPDLRSYKTLKELKGLRNLSVSCGVPIFILHVLRHGCISNGHESDIPLAEFQVDDCIENVEGQLSVTLQLVDRAITSWFDD